MLNSRPFSDFHNKFLRIGLSQEAPTVGMMHMESVRGVLVEAYF